MPTLESHLVFYPEATLICGCVAIRRRRGVACPGLMSPWGKHLATAVGEIRTVQLEGGSQVTPDTDAAPAPFVTRGERRLKLETRPSAVRGGAGYRSALPSSGPAAQEKAGRTTFDLRLSADRSVDVALVHGAIGDRRGPRRGLEGLRTIEGGRRLRG